MVAAAAAAAAAEAPAAATVVPEEDLWKNNSSKNSSSSSSGKWMRLFRRKIRIFSPIRCITSARDSYVRGMTNFASSNYCGAGMVQGPHSSAALSRNASRHTATADDEDFRQLVRAASSRKSGAGILPRSSSVQGPPKLMDLHLQQQDLRRNLPRSVTHSGIPRFQLQKQQNRQQHYRATLETTQEE